MNFHPIRAWNRFWFAPISARPLGAFRVVYGILAVANLLLLTVDFDYWLTDVGLLRGREALEMAGTLRFSPLNVWHDPTTVRCVFGLTLAASIGLTLGWRTRIMSILYYAGLLSIHHRNVATASGADVLFMNVAFLLMLSPCGAAYSLDALRESRRRGGMPADPLIIPWAQRLLQIQIGVVYTATSILKASGLPWLDGTALHYVLCNQEVARFHLGFLAAYPILVNFLTYGGLVTEFLLAFLLWNRASRPWVIPLGISLHLGILVLVNIPLFGELTTACYIVFLSSDEWEWLRANRNPLAWARRVLARARPESPGRLTGPIGIASAEVVGSPRSA